MLQHMCIKNSISASSPWYWWRFSCHTEAPGRGKSPWFLNWTQTVKLAIILYSAVLCFHWSACSMEGFLGGMLIFMDVSGWRKWRLAEPEKHPALKASLNLCQSCRSSSKYSFIPHWGHWQACLAPSSLVLSRIWEPSHFGPKAH